MEPTTGFMRIKRLNTDIARCTWKHVELNTVSIEHITTPRFCHVYTSRSNSVFFSYWRNKFMSSFEFRLPNSSPNFLRDAFEETRRGRGFRWAPDGFGRADARWRGRFRAVETGCFEACYNLYNSYWDICLELDWKNLLQLFWLYWQSGSFLFFNCHDVKKRISTGTPPKSLAIYHQLPQDTV